MGIGTREGTVVLKGGGKAHRGSPKVRRSRTERGTRWSAPEWGPQYRPRQGAGTGEARRVGPHSFCKHIQEEWSCVKGARRTLKRSKRGAATWSPPGEGASES